MSTRRKLGDWVWLRPGAGFVGESWRLKAEIVQGGAAPPGRGDGAQLPPCFLCDDADCREWYTLLTEPDPQTGARYGLPHVSECEMFDAQQTPNGM